MGRRPPHDPAIVFDCDGVLVDSEDAWTRAESALFAGRGLSYGPEEKRRLVGTSMPETGRILERWFGQPSRTDAILAELVELAAVEFGRGSGRSRVLARSSPRSTGAARSRWRRTRRGRSSSRRFAAPACGIGSTSWSPATRSLDRSRRRTCIWRPAVGWGACPRRRWPSRTLHPACGRPEPRDCTWSASHVAGVDRADLVASALGDPEVRAALGLPTADPL